MKKASVFKRIKWWWYGWSWKGLRERTKEVILFIPVLHKVVPWDYSSLFTIMEYWVGRMKKSHELDTWHFHADVKVQELKVTKELLRRLKDNNYTDSFHEEHDKRWGESKMSWKPSSMGKGYKECILNRDKVLSDQDKIQERKEFKWIMDQDNKLFLQDLDYLHRMFRKKIRGWWT